MKRVEAGHFQKGNSPDEAQGSSFPQYWIEESMYQSDSLAHLAQNKLQSLHGQKQKRIKWQSSKVTSFSHEVTLSVL